MRSFLAFRFLVLIALLPSALPSLQAQSILISSNSGSAIASLTTNQGYSYNFGITTLGGNQSLELTNIGIYMDRGNNTTQPFTVAIYSGLGASGPLLTNFTVAATNIRSTMSLFNLLFQGSLTLTNGNYSLTLSTSTPSGGATQYTLRQGTLALLDSNNAPLPLTYWVQDSNTSGTAGTNFQANFVLADYQVDTRSINYGNFRLGANLSTAVTLTNNAIFATNSSGAVVSEQLTTVAGATNAATVSGLNTNLLSVNSTTNFTVGMSSSSVGTNSGTVTLTYNSVSNGTASARPASLGTNPVGLGSQEITVTGVGYRLAAEALSATNVDLGRFHIGASNLSTALGLTNTSVNDGFSESLLVTNGGITGGATLGGLPGGLLVAGSSTNFTVGLAGVSSVGTNLGTITLGFQSSGSGTSGLAATNIGSQVVNVIAQGYSGQAVWSVDANGAWGNFGNWNVAGGTPGIDGVLSTNDTATFAGAISTARTVSLAGQNPVLTTMTFSNASASYTVAPGAGGTEITMGTAQGAGLITNAAGTHTVATAVALARDTVVGVNGAALVRFSGGISGQKDLTKTGSGVLVIEGLNSLTGITRVAAGDMVVNGSLASSGVAIDGGAALWGHGKVGAISGAGSVNPGNSPGILTAPSLDPSGGLTFNFELTGPNPDYTDALASVNDVLRLTDSTPFSASLTPANTVNIFFNVAASQVRQVYTGGFYTDVSQDFLERIFGASFNYYVRDDSGSVTYGGVNYSVLGGDLTITLSTVNRTAEFDDVIVDGYVMQLDVIPEPRTYALLGMSAAALAAYRWRRRRREK